MHTSDGVSRWLTYDKLKVLNLTSLIDHFVEQKKKNTDMLEIVCDRIKNGSKVCMII